MIRMMKVVDGAIMKLSIKCMMIIVMFRIVLEAVIVEVAIVVMWKKEVLARLEHILVESVKKV